MFRLKCQSRTRAGTGEIGGFIRGSSHLEPDTFMIIWGAKVMRGRGGQAGALSLPAFRLSHRLELARLEKPRYLAYVRRSRRALQRSQLEILERCLACKQPEG